MKAKIKRNWGIIFFLMFIVCILIMGFFYIAFNETKEFDYRNEVLNVDKAKFHFTAEYPVFNNGKLNKSVDILIDSKKSYLNNNKDELDGKLSYSHTIYRNIYSFHFKTLYLKEDKEVGRDDDIKYYNINNYKELELKDIVSLNENYYQVIKQIIKNYAKANKEYVHKNDITDNECTKIVFSEDKAYLISVIDTKEYMIPIEYGYLKKYLNDNFFKISEGKDLEIEKEPVKTVEVPKKEEVKKEEKKETKKTTTPKKVTPKEELKSTNDGSIDKYIPKVRDASYFQGKKLIAFTFDDGPAGKYTTKLLDGLKARNAKVTFFMVGNRVKSNAAIVRRMKAEGHSIGQHSYSHANLKKLSNTDPNKAKNEIYLANDAIKAVLGENPRYIRPPYGAYNSDVLSYADMVFVNWSIDPLDWKYRNANTVFKNITSKAYDGAIVLVHDIHPTSVDGALRAIDYLMQRGYAIVSLDEMVQLRGINLQTHHLYTNFKKK